MMTDHRRVTARRNVRKAAASAKKKWTLKRLPKKTRAALGKQAAKLKRQKAKK
jgi:uncharacterized protein (UPF0147 family)